MRNIRAFILTVMTIVVSVSCKERFDPKIAPSQTNFLVVEGFINAKGSTAIRLSRSVSLKNSSRIRPELNAVVRITGEDNSAYTIRSAGNGQYVSDFNNLNSTQKYRLHIKTSSGGEYLSEWAAVKQAPSIDSISWKLQDNGGVGIFVTSHDPQNNTRYYKWDFEETWEIHSAFTNYLEYKNGKITSRPAEQVPKLYYCWKNQRSTSILVGSTAQLTNDVMNLAPITFVAPNSEKTSVRYSVLLKQYAIDRRSYDFFNRMKSNTESLGSIFDAQPSEIIGNITCVSNPAERVVGYITASTVDEKRIFISRSQVPSQYTDNCESLAVANNPDSFKLYFNSFGLLPYEPETAGGPTNAYLSSTAGCIDCTLRGTNVKPSFW